MLEVLILEPKQRHAHWGRGTLTQDGDTGWDSVASDSHLGF